MQYDARLEAAGQIERALSCKLWALGWDRIAHWSRAPIWHVGTQYSNPARDSLDTIFRLGRKIVLHACLRNILERATCKSIGLQYDPVSLMVENLSPIFAKVKQRAALRKMEGY